MLELYYNFFDRFCDVDKFEELEMDTDSLYLAIAHENLNDCIRPAKKQEWETFERRTVMIPSEQMPRTAFSLENVAQNTKSTIKESQDSSKKNSDATKWFVSAAKPIVATMPSLTSTNLVIKAWKKVWKRLEMDQWKNIDEW